MQAQATSDRAQFVLRAVESKRLDGREDLAPESLAMWEDRVRRRIEFRLSLARARAAQARVEGRTIAQQSVRQLSTGFMDSPSRLMADLVNAH